jgi:hypothetical protein
MPRLIQSLFLVCAGVLSSQADIIYTPLDPPLAMWTSGPQILEPLDFNGDGTPELTLGADVGFLGVRAEGETRLLVFTPPPPNLPGPVEPLATGFDIGLESEIGSIIWFEGYSNDPGHPSYNVDFRTLVSCLDTGCSGRFRGQQAYMGVEFELPDGIHYGWVWLSVSETVASGSVGGFAYESEPGMPIIAGAVPEPSSILLLGIGTLAILLALAKTRNR